MAKSHALARRLIDREADYLRFTTDPDDFMPVSCSTAAPSHSASATD
jgi:hypothetical protein